MVKEEEVSGQWSAVIGEEVNIEHPTSKWKRERVEALNLKYEI
jgi:hypothetical protein